ncbi:MAG TPA: GIY-YIG nuclease family protein [Gemmatimonadales bacterium]|nr:GIY-YIG nuclease family protein [Gemmatimonadales bacterium]
MPNGRKATRRPDGDPPPGAPWLVYVLSCADGSLYTGVTNDLTRRLRAHARGVGAKYTRSRRPVTLVYAVPAAGRGAALSREAAIKRLSRSAKLALVLRPHPFSSYVGT